MYAGISIRTSLWLESSSTALTASIIERFRRLRPALADRGGPSESRHRAVPIRKALYLVPTSALEPVAVLVLHALPLVIDLPLLSLAKPLSSSLAFRRLGIRPVDTTPNHLGRCFGAGFGDIKFDDIFLEDARDGEVAESSLAGLEFVEHCRPIGAWGGSKLRTKPQISALGVAPYQLELSALDISHQNHPPTRFPCVPAASTSPPTVLDDHGCPRR